MNGFVAGLVAHVKPAVALVLPGKAVLVTLATAIAVATVATAATVVIPGPRAQAEPHHTFRISGVAETRLSPSAVASVDVSLTNPNSRPLAITRLDAQISAITTRAGSGPCGQQDFAVRQFSGEYGFVVGPSRTTTLGRIGVPSSQWPQITMIDRPVNQDGCKNALISISFTGEATGG
jgi:hypothetical protein